MCNLSDAISMSMLAAACRRCAQANGNPSADKLKQSKTDI
jgi:hypothetical protein